MAQGNDSGRQILGGPLPLRGGEAQAQNVRMRRRAAGVTLMEMLVVMALASILLAIVFPAVGSGLGTLELRSAATRLAAAARYARDQAVYRQGIYELQLDSARGVVAVEDFGGGQSQRFELPSSVHIADVSPQEEGTGPAVRRFFFYPDGAAQQFQVILANPRRQMAVSNDPLTGTATVEER
jgi:general secretion pathway protein H